MPNYQWWNDTDKLALLAVHDEVLRRFYPEAKWVINEHGNYAARLIMHGRRIAYTVEAEYPSSFPHGGITGRVVSPDTRGLDSIVDHVFANGLICVHDLSNADTTATSVLKTCAAWITNYGERRFG